MKEKGIGKGKRVKENSQESLFANRKLLFRYIETRVFCHLLRDIMFPNFLEKKCLLNISSLYLKKRAPVACINGIISSISKK